MTAPRFSIPAIVLILATATVLTADEGTALLPPEKREDAIAVRGTVTNTEGKPVAECFVGCFAPDLRDRFVQTDSNGRFVFSVPIDTCGDCYSFWATTKDQRYTGYGKPAFKEGDKNVPDVSIVLEPLALTVPEESRSERFREITGKVLDAKNNPVPGALVGGFLYTTYGEEGATDSSGHYRFFYPKGVKLNAVYAFKKKPVSPS